MSPSQHRPVPRHAHVPALLDYRDVDAATVAAVTADAITSADALVDRVAATPPDTPSYATTLHLLDDAGRIVGDAYGAGAFMARVHPDAAVREAATEAEERLTKWGSDLVFRRDLYDAVSRFAATAEADALEGERRRALDHWVRDFRRTGHDLDEADRTLLQELKNRLIELEVAFSRNLDEAEDSIVVPADRIGGLPDTYVEGLDQTEDGDYIVTLAYPDYMPFMDQAEDRDLRRQLQFKFWNKAAETNRTLLEEALAIRQQIAGLLGYPTWAHYATEVKMAGNPDQVIAFYDSLVPGLTVMAERELATLGAMLPDDEGPVMSWDWRYLHDLQRRQQFGIDSNEVAAYFPLEQVIAGMFEITGDVFGLDYSRVEDTRAWHPDVYVYEIRNRGSEAPLAYFYADLFPREGKFGHAAAFPIRYGMEMADGSYRTPVAAIVANFTKPTTDSPSLLKHDEALTLFHEFGHILHFCLTTAKLHRFSGYDTEWDFVEAPSQIMENWMWEPEVLQRFARHHRTDEPIPTDLVARLVAGRDLDAGLLNVRQAFLGRLDMDMHHARVGDDLDDITRDAYALTLLPFHEGTFFPAGFGHLMGGYDAGYYGYLWSAVYGDDMFSAFETEGITSPAVGMRYRDEVLARGGSRDAMDHLRAFLGREPNSDAFLRKLGLT